MQSVRALVALGTFAAFAACSSPTEGPKPTTLVITPTAVELTAIGATRVLAVVVNDQNGAAMTGQVPTFTSSATGVVTVSTGGLLTAVATGSANVTVTVGSLTETVPVTVTQVPSEILKSAGDAQIGEENQPLPNALRVTVRDSRGNPIPGVSVTFTVSGGGSVSASPVTTNGSGEAQTTWTLGASTSTHSVTATAGSAPAAVFTAAAVSATASNRTIARLYGEGQIALLGSATNIRPAVRVTNGLGNVANAAVTFRVTSGGGSIVGDSVVMTNAQGIAQVEGWVVGAGAGANTLMAIGAGTYTGGANSVTFTATAQASGYNLEVRNVGAAMSTEVQAAFDAAAAFWQSVIIGDLSNVTFNNQSVCGGLATLNETIDDVVILARIEAIDGPGAILGQAGPCSVRSSNALTIVGQMRFDEADMANMAAAGTLNAVILHEMGHVLGFSFNLFTISTSAGYSRSCGVSPTSGSPPSVVSSDTHFACEKARAAFDSLGGLSYTGGMKVPLENCASGVASSCGGGTYNSHWREATFFNEMMTGYVNSGVANPMSRLTIAAFEDLGYTVNYSVAQPYSRTFTDMAGSANVLFGGSQRIPLVDDVIRGPVEVVDARGRVVKVIQQ